MTITEYELLKSEYECNSSSIEVSDKLYLKKIYKSQCGRTNEQIYVFKRTAFRNFIFWLMTKILTFYVLT